MGRKPPTAKSLANLRPAQPGEVRNPAGRPKTPDEVRDAFRAASAQAVTVLVDIMLNGKSEDTRVKAAGVVLDRAYGKATQAVDVRVTDVGAMHLQLLEEIRARRQERIGQAPIDVTPTYTQIPSENVSVEINKTNGSDDDT